MDSQEFFHWVEEHNEGTEFVCKKDQVYVFSCGTKTYTWFIKEGIMFTALQTEYSEGELANTIWRAGDMVHSLDDDIMLPCHPLTDCVLVRYNSDHLNQQIRANAELSWYLAEYYHHQFTSTLSNFRHSALDSSEVRLAFLEKRLHDFEELKDEHISDATLALFMGMHRVSVNRIRKKLAANGTPVPLDPPE